MPFKEDSEKLKGLLEKAKKFWDDLGDADPNADQKKEISTINAETAELSAVVSESKEFRDQRETQEKLRLDLSKPLGAPDYGNVDGRKGREGEQKTWGKQFTESKQYKDLLEFCGASEGKEISQSLSIQTISQASAPVQVKNLITGLSVTRDTGGSGIVRPDYQGVVPLFLRPLSLRDVFTVGQTGSDLVEFTSITSFDNRAAPTAEATSVPTTYAQAGNGLKPQSGMTTALVKLNVKTIPHWMPITRRAMSDAPQLETYIDNFLMQGCEIILEDQMITGNNVGENFQGLDNTPGITLQPFVTNALITTRKARTKVRTIGRAVATGFLMHPNDWEAIDLTQDGQQRYFFGGPLAMGQKTLWGLPVIESEAVLEGTFYVGDLKQAVLWDRERANIRISDSPYDMFLRNELAILCELRAAFGVLRPAAIVRGDFTAGPNS